MKYSVFRFQYSDHYASTMSSKPLALPVAGKPSNADLFRRFPLKPFNLFNSLNYLLILTALVMSLLPASAAPSSNPSIQPSSVLAADPYLWLEDVTAERALA